MPRELDEAIAIIMGWECIEQKQLPRNHWPWCRPDGNYTYNLPAFSVDIHAAMDVVEWLQNQGRRIDMIAYRANIVGHLPFRVEIRSMEHDLVMAESYDCLADAICRAALEATDG